MPDPTLEEMREFLATVPYADECDEFDCEEAIYWFAADYHGGQGSNLYSALCRSEFKPGPIACEPQGIAWELYGWLEIEFAGGNIR